MGSAWSSTLSNLFISYCLGSPIFIFHYCIGDELCDRFGDRGAKEPEPDEKMFFYHIKHTHTRDAERENLAGSKEKQNLQFKYTENLFSHLTPKPSFFREQKMSVVEKLRNDLKACEDELPKMKSLKDQLDKLIGNVEERGLSFFMSLNFLHLHKS